MKEKIIVQKDIREGIEEFEVDRKGEPKEAEFYVIDEAKKALERFEIDENDIDILQETLDSAKIGNQWKKGEAPEWDFPSHVLAAYGRIKPEVIAKKVLADIKAPLSEKNIKTAISWIGYLDAEAYVKKDTPYAKENLEILSKWTGGTLHEEK